MAATLERLLVLAVFGAVGTLARFGVYAACQREPLSHLPAGTLIVNVAGSFVFGLIWPLAESHAGADPRMSPELRLYVLSGFMGAFTTFSTFAFETGRYLHNGQPLAAVLNLVANNVLGIGAFALGWWLSPR